MSVYHILCKIWECWPMSPLLAGILKIYMMELTAGESAWAHGTDFPWAPWVGWAGSRATLGWSQKSLLSLLSWMGMGHKTQPMNANKITMFIKSLMVKYHQRKGICLILRKHVDMEELWNHLNSDHGMTNKKLSVCNKSNDDETGTDHMHNSLSTCYLSELFILE